MGFTVSIDMNLKEKKKEGREEGRMKGGRKKERKARYPIYGSVPFYFTCL